LRAKRSNLRSGLLDRYPNLKFIFEEGNVGYALYLFDRLEAGWEFGEMIYGSRVHLRGPKKRPLEYLEHFHWAVESEDSLIAEVVKRWGAERILFSTDYPHGDTPWPESVKEMKEALAPYWPPIRPKCWAAMPRGCCICRRCRIPTISGRRSTHFGGWAMAIGK